MRQSALLSRLSVKDQVGAGWHWQLVELLGRTLTTNEVTHNQIHLVSKLLPLSVDFLQDGPAIAAIKIEIINHPSGGEY